MRAVERPAAEQLVDEPAAAQLSAEPTASPEDGDVLYRVENTAADAMYIIYVVRSALQPLTDSENLLYVDQMTSSGGALTFTFADLGESYEVVVRSRAQTVTNYDCQSGAHCPMQENDVPASCVQAGYSGDSFCRFCGAELAKGEVIPKTDHTYSAVETPATCTEKGYTTFTCTVCEDTYTGDETETIPHSYDTIVTAPTCTEKGITTYICSVCGDTYSDETDALGHRFGAWVIVKEATQTEAGQKRRECSACDAFETLPIPMLSTIAIRNFQSNRKLDYRTTITFAAEVTNPANGGEIRWFVDGKDMGTGDTYTMKEAKKNFTVQAKYMQDGKVLAESETETVKVKNGFFDKLKAFFRALFRKLPVVVQEYLGVEIIDRTLP